MKNTMNYSFTAYRFPTDRFGGLSAERWHHSENVTKKGAFSGQSWIGSLGLAVSPGWHPKDESPEAGHVPRGWPKSWLAAGPLFK